jgi:hypothetical protein
LSVLRSHKFEENAKIAVKEKYPFSHAASMNIENITTDRDQIKAFIEGTEEQLAVDPTAEPKPVGEAVEPE